MKEHLATEEMTHLATLPTWPKANAEFTVQFKVKVILPIPYFQTVLLFRPDSYPQGRLPSFHLNDQGKIHAFFRCDSTNDQGLVGRWQDITPGIYHQISLKQELDTEKKFRVKFYINGVRKGLCVNTIPGEVYNNVKILVAESVNNAIYFIKDLDYFF